MRTEGTREHGEGKIEHLHIFVNRKKFDEGITPTMTVDAIARLVGLTEATATVRRETGGKSGDPLTGTVDIHQADHFVVTRKTVEGGFDSLDRVKNEIAKLDESGQRTTVVKSPAAVIYHSLPTGPGAPVGATDVLVLVPSGYPAAMLDLAFLPHPSPLVGRVKGQAQEVIQADGRSWQRISYHPHNGGGGPPWNPKMHGFHTYIDEILTWLGRIQ